MGGRARFLFVTIALAGCESLDGLATQSAATDPTTDAGRDASTGTSTKSSGEDAGADTATSASFCEAENGKHLLCSDFESPYVLDGVWEATSIDPGSTLERTQGGLSAKTASLASGAQADALLLKNFTRRVKKTTLAFNLKIGSCAPTGNGNANLASIGQGDPDQKWIVALLLRPGGVVFNTTRCSGTCNGNDYTLATPPLPNVWSRVAMTVDVQAATASVTVDGKTSVEQSITLVDYTTDALLLNVGLNVRGQVGDCLVEYDDVTFDVE